MKKKKMVITGRFEQKSPRLELGINTKRIESGKRYSRKRNRLGSKEE